MFYINLGIAVIITAILFLLVFWVLSIYTRHGDTILVPDFTGSTLEDIRNENLQKEFSFIVMDSVYDPDAEKGSIIQQDPLPYAKVKKGRKIYITIVAKLPEKVPMPNLVDLSLRQALVELKTSDLKVNYLNYVSHFAENAILAQMYLGDTIKPGTLIKVGTRIDLVIGRGLSNNKVPVPFLIGKKKSRAHDLIYKGTFNIGKEYYLDVEDTSSVRVYKQEPAWDSDTLLPHGDYINIWYRSELNFDFDKYLESLLPDTTAMDSTTLDPLELRELQEQE
ncbi:MAG: PASTA domain-containing protein [Bacteroidales bacterium]|nr:PASTA domain-containing protein [Bacteroidales bacterium]MCF8387520.1 PASTA domain-containing protein [Bacteroidales bacterium]MCF8398328.1 PASTA domain-containing protein [Bacteroidales bacterium]